MKNIKEDIISFKGKFSYPIFLYLICLNPGFRAVFIYRLSNVFFEKKYFKLISLILYNLNLALHGCEIKPSAKIKGGFKIAHPTGIVIGEGVVIGHNFTIFQHVTLGAKNPNSPKYPIIEDNVCIYLKASILGKVIIKENTLVKGNSFIVE